MFSKFDELEDIVRENTILIKKNRALVSINHDNLHNAYRAVSYTHLTLPTNSLV